MATSSYQAGQTYAADRADAGTARGVGWLTFAAVILGFAGTFNLIDGIVALSKSKFYTHSAVFVFSDLRTWGWIILLLGIVQVFAAFAAALRFSASSLACSRVNAFASSQLLEGACSGATIGSTLPYFIK